MFTPNLALPLIAASQAQKHVPVNEALQILDALTTTSQVMPAPTCWRVSTATIR
jgi:hypothetical protein